MCVSCATVQLSTVYNVQGRCNREKPPCKYFHPPQHLKDQLLTNGRNYLALKNLALQSQSQMPHLPVLAPAVVSTWKLQVNLQTIHSLCPLFFCCHRGLFHHLSFAFFLLLYFLFFSFSLFSLLLHLFRHQQAFPFFPVKILLSFSRFSLALCKSSYVSCSYSVRCVHVCLLKDVLHGITKVYFHSVSCFILSSLFLFAIFIN